MDANLVLTARQLPPPIPESLRLLIAPWFFGVAFNWLLLGAALLQLYWYFLQFPNDPRIIKSLVYVVILVDLFQTAFSTVAAYQYLVQYWGITAITTDAPSTVIVGPICSAIVASLAHCFFVWRIYVLGRRSWFASVVCILILLLSLCQMIGAFVGGALFLHDGSSLSALKKVFSGFTVWLAGSLAADVMIAASMLVILHLARRRTSFKDTSDLITKLSRVTIQTGVITAICATVELIVFLHFINNDIHQVFAYILGKLYTNSLLGNLNSRRRVDRSSTSSSDNSGTYLWISQSNKSQGLSTGRSIELHSRLRNQTRSEAPTSTTISVNQQVYTTFDDDAYKTGLSSISTMNQDSRTIEITRPADSKV